MTEPVAIPIEDALDLHGFRPEEIQSVVAAYLEAAHDAGLREVRLIHGRGIGQVLATGLGAFTAGPLAADGRSRNAG